jgi:hypothetical protein
MIYTSSSNNYIINFKNFPVNSVLFYIDKIDPFKPTQISPNKITGTAQPKTIIVVNEKSLTNEEITYKLQPNDQGILNFNITVPSNAYSFTYLNTNLYTTLQNNFSAKYREKSYQLTTGVPTIIKPRIYASNSFDARWWRISPKLPEGLNFSQTTGIISGTPMSAIPTTRYIITSNSQIYLSSRMEITLEIV